MLYILLSFGIFIFLLFVVFLRLRKGVSLSSMQTDDSNKPIKPFEVLEVRLSKNEGSTDAGGMMSSARLAEQMFSALHGLLREDSALQESISFEMVSSTEQGIRFYVCIPHGILKFVESQIYAQYPNAQIRVTKDYAETLITEHASEFEIVNLGFTRPLFFPIKVHTEFEIDPISSLASAMSSLPEGSTVSLQFIIKPEPDTWQKEGAKYVASVREGLDPTSNGPSFKDAFVGVLKKESVGFATGMATGLFHYSELEPQVKKPLTTPAVRLTPTQDVELRAIENKLSHMGYRVNIRIASVGLNRVMVDSNSRGIIAALRQYSNSSTNTFSISSSANSNSALDTFNMREFDGSKSILLNTEELATIYHFPTGDSSITNMSWVYSKNSEPPANLPTENCTYIGETMFRNKKVKFGLKNDDDRLRHMYVIGKSGTGKSTCLESMIVQDIANGAGVGVLDPHGETIEHILQRIPDSRIDDVIYFDPSDTEFPIGLNLLEIDDPSQKNLMASGLIAAIKQHFDYSWGPRLEYLLNYALLTLLDVPGTSMLSITRLLEDQNYQKYILHFVKDPIVVRFWEKEFKEMKGNQKLITEAIAPIQNKVNRFLASTTIRNILGQKKSTLDIWDAMNSGKILLINLSKGKIGSDNANLLGALLVSRIQFYALQRSKIPYEERRPFYLYVDEFQNFATGSFEEILSESRKYKLGLYLTHQFTAQLPEELLDAVYGNVGTLMSLSLGAPDAKELSKEFDPYFEAADIISLERFQCYIKLIIDGMTSPPFSARILLPWQDDFLIPKSNNREKVIQRSREQYGVPREHVEAKIAKWVETDFNKGKAIAKENRDKGLQSSPSVIDENNLD